MNELPKYVLHYLVFIALATSVFAFIMYYKTRSKEQKSKERKYFKEKRFFPGLLKLSFFERLDKWLKEAGYTLEGYLIINLMIFAASLIIGVQSGYGQGIKLVCIMLLPFNILISYKIKRKRGKLQLELCNIQDILYFQTRIGTPLDVILAYASNACGEPLKTPLSNLAERFKLSCDLERELENFRMTSSLMEFQAFVLTLKQSLKTGFSEENYKAQSTMLKRSKRMRKRILREYKRIKLIFASVLLFACYTSLALVPLLKTVLNSLDLILK